MPATDLEQRVREAMVALVNADATLRTLCGRTSGLAVERDTLAQDVALPVLAYDLMSYDQGTGRVLVLFTAVADGGSSGATCRALLERLALVLTTAAFATQTLDVAVWEGVRQSVDEVQDVRDRLDLASPLLTQADWSLPLLVLD